MSTISNSAYILDASEARAIASQIRATYISTGVLAVVFVILRFMARWQRRLKPSLDDYLIALSLVFLAGGMAVIEIVIETGVETSDIGANFASATKIGKFDFAYEYIFLAHISTVKIAILITYYRVFNHRRYKIATYILSAVVVAWCISFVISNAVECVPVALNWDKSLNGTCLNYALMFIANSASNIIIDLAMIFMPIREVWKLQMSIHQRINLTILFLLGGFVTFTSIYRLYLLIDFTEGGLVNLTADRSFAVIVGTLIWCHIECCATSISACLPILRPLVELFLYKTSLRSKGPSRTSKSAWRSDISSCNMKSHVVRSEAFHISAEEDIWPPVTNTSSDEVPLRLVRSQVEKK